MELRLFPVVSVTSEPLGDEGPPVNIARGPNEPIPVDLKRSWFSLTHRFVAH
jgi:hypothetical protein